MLSVNPTRKLESNNSQQCSTAPDISHDTLNQEWNLVRSILVEFSSKGEFALTQAYSIRSACALINTLQTIVKAVQSLLGEGFRW